MILDSYNKEFKIADIDEQRAMIKTLIKDLKIHNDLNETQTRSLINILIDIDIRLSIGAVVEIIKWPNLRKYIVNSDELYHRLFNFAKGNYREGPLDDEYAQFVSEIHKDLMRSTTDG